MRLSNIESMIDNDGQITIGQMSFIGAVAIANDESGTLAMLRKHPAESLVNLLGKAIEHALEHDEIIDEINRR